MTNKTRAYISKIIGIPELDAAQLNMEVNFIYKSTVVKSLNKRSIEISSFTCIEDYDSCHESERYARSEQLVCLGILCFFTYLPFTMAYMEEAQSSVILDDSTEHFEEIEPKFISEGIDHSRNLKKLLAKLEGDTELSVTIIDRIRKGLYLEQQSHCANLHHDEAFLIYFGIIEMLADHYSKDYKKQLENSLKNMLNSFYIDNSYYSSNRLNEIVTHKYRLLYEVLVRDELSLKNRILYSCEVLNLKHNYLESFIGDLIKQRNNVAHGKTIYRDEFIWPLPPFFSSLYDSTTNLETIFYFMINLVYHYFDLKPLDELIVFFNNIMIPTKEFINQLQEGSIDYHFSKDELLNGNDFMFTYETIFYLFVHKMENISIDEIVNIVRDEFLDTEINEECGPILMNISILFSDSKDNLVNEKAKENIKSAVKNNWFYWSNIKDALRYLDYYKTKSTWFKEWILNDGHIICRK